VRRLRSRHEIHAPHRDRGHRVRNRASLRREIVPDVPDVPVEASRHHREGWGEMSDELERMTDAYKHMAKERDSLRARVAELESQLDGATAHIPKSASKMARLRQERDEMKAELARAQDLCTERGQERDGLLAALKLMEEERDLAMKERDEAYSMRDSMLKERADAAKRWKGFEKKSRAYRRKVDAKLSLARVALGRAQKRAAKSIHGSACQCEDCRVIAIQYPKSHISRARENGCCLTAARPSTKA